MSEAGPLVSIVIPAFNAADHLASCVTSALSQRFDPDRFEIVIVDDHSTDRTLALARRLAEAARNVVVLQTPVNGGPGIARNLGVSHARGRWILFLDSDDALEPDALARLDAFLAAPGAEDCDAVGFDWHAADRPVSEKARRDAGPLTAGRAALISSYLALHMDGSVIFTLVRRALIETHGLRFAPGVHEDVDYLFRVYWHARRVLYLDAVLYAKRRRPGSIVNTVTTRHIHGFLRAWDAIGRFLRADGDATARVFLPAWRTGLVGLLATRIREIRRCAPDPAAAAALHEALHAGWQALAQRDGGVDLQSSRTKYFQIAHTFLAIMERVDLDAAARAQAIEAELQEIMSRSWSCTDLHHSVFLAPDQIRTCCKRFFVDGKMRGDVVLLEVADRKDVSAGRIAQAKQALHTAINRGDPTDCDGCPFLEFKEWGPIEPLRLNYLSFEYHSVCNLVCTYCSETYYGGVKARYDVQGLVDGFIADGLLEPAAQIVWGGGEPVADRKFTPIIDRLADRLPQATQRVLTNAVTQSATVERLLAAGRITVTTSIDAGTVDTFARIRGRDRLDKVIRTLQRYAAADPSRVTLKYIFTEGNESLDEVRAFVDRMRAAGLLGCNFQISHDFKSESVDESVLVSIVALYGLLIEAGCRVVFFDDLLRHRLVGMPEATAVAIRRSLAAAGLGDVLIDAEACPELVIWGAGWQAKYLLENALFFKQVRPAFLVDSTPSKIGGAFLGHDVRDPQVLLHSDLPVLIAAVQGYPGIHAEFVRLGLPETRLVTRLVI